MNQADRDSEKWQESFIKWHAKELIRVKEFGELYHVDQLGNVIIDSKAKEILNEQ
jgi:hypothetical protein